MTAPIVPLEAQDLASSFIDHTLPKLLADDIRLARQLGFREGMNDTAILDRALPLLRIYRKDVIQYATETKPDPLKVVNNANNWQKNPAGRLVPKRMVFPIKAHEATSELDPYSWSSITLEYSPSGAWRIIQFGAPILSQAIKRFETRQTNQFLLWIPDLNRHYLGQISTGGADTPLASIELTALFDDSLAHRKAGDKFEATSPEFIEHLKQLYQDLDLPKKPPRGQTQSSPTQTQTPIQAR
jgi:hypothetical protein